MEKPKNRPHAIKTADMIDIKFGTVDYRYVGESAPRTKFRVNLPLIHSFIHSRGAARQIGEIYAKVFIYTFYFNEPIQFRPLGKFLCTTAQTTQSHAWTLVLTFDMTLDLT